MLPKALIAGFHFAPNHNIPLIAVTTSTAEGLLKSKRHLEEAIRNLLLPSATYLQKEVQVRQVVINNVCTAIDACSNI